MLKRQEMGFRLEFSNGTTVLYFKWLGISDNGGFSTVETSQSVGHRDGGGKIIDWMG